MAIMPHCVVCGFYSGSEVAGSVKFADYHPAWQPPRAHDGTEVLGWCNSLGVTAAEGIGLFCRTHLARARRLRKLSSADAVARLRDEDAKHPSALRRLYRSVLRRG